MNLGEIEEMQKILDNARDYNSGKINLRPHEVKRMFSMVQELETTVNLKVRDLVSQLESMCFNGFSDSQVKGLIHYFLGEIGEENNVFGWNLPAGWGTRDKYSMYLLNLETSTSILVNSQSLISFGAFERNVNIDVRGSGDGIDGEIAARQCIGWMQVDMSCGIKHIAYETGRTGHNGLLGGARIKNIGLLGHGWTTKAERETQCFLF